MNSEEKAKKEAAFTQALKILVDNRLTGDDTERSAIIFLNCIGEDEANDGKMFASGEILLNGSVYSFYNLLLQAMKGNKSFTKALVMAAANNLSDSENPLHLVMAKMLLDEAGTMEEAGAECNCPSCKARRENIKNNINVN